MAADEFPRILLLALDATPPGLLDECCREGLLPNISALRAEGRWGLTDSEADLFPAAVWPTFFTRSDVSHHGNHHLIQWNRATKRLRPPDVTCPAIPFWRDLARSGVTSIALDVPFAAAGPPVTGAIEVVGWGMHEGIWSWSSPPNLLPELRRRHGRANQRREGPGDRPLAEVVEELPGIVTDVGRRVGVIEDLAARSEWRFFLACFSETHRAGHWFWTDRGLGRPQEGVRRVLRAFDEQLPRLRRLLRPQDYLVVFSVHGMQYSYDSDRFGEAVARYLDPPRIAPRRRAVDPVRLARNVAPQGLARAIARRLPQSLYNWTYYRLRNTTGDWANLSWVVSTLDHLAYLYHNTPHDRVGISPEEQEWLRSRLEGMRTLDGRQLVRRMVRPEELYSGPLVHLLPDVIAEPALQTIGPRVVLADGSLREAPRNAGRDGEHAAQGFYIQAGPGIAAGTTGPATRGQDLARLLLDPAGVRI